MAALLVVVLVGKRAAMTVEQMAASSVEKMAASLVQMKAERTAASLVEH